MSQQSLIDLLKSDEGWRDTPYDDHTGARIDPGDTLIGNLTVGYGHNLHEPLPKATGLALLALDIETAQHELDRNLPWWRTLDFGRQMVLINLAFNLGLPRLLKFKQTLLLLQQKHYTDAARELLRSQAAEDAPARYTRLARLLETGSVEV